MPKKYIQNPWAMFCFYLRIECFPVRQLSSHFLVETWCGVHPLASYSAHDTPASPLTVPTSPALSSVQSLSHVQLFLTPWTTACQASLSSTNSRSLPKLISIESVMPSNHFISVITISSCIQSFPASGSFPVSQLFTSGGQRIGVSASASVLPMNTQDWSPLGWTGWISMQSKELSRVFSNTTGQKHQFFSAQLYL